MFGCMPLHGCGYNPRTSDTLTGLQMGIAGLNGLTNIFEAKNSGADTATAVAYGLNSATMGMGNALLGNVIDKNTHSYIGTTMNTVAPMLTGNNPYMATPILAQTALFSSAMHPLMHNPPMMMGGFYSSWATPFMGPMMMGGMPRFGHFHCCC